MGERILHNIMPLLKIILFIFFIFICLLPFGLIAQMEFITIPKDSILSDLVLEGALVIVVISALLMMFQTFPTINFKDVFVEKEHALSGFLKGTGIGLILILIAGAILFLLGFVDFSLGKISVAVFLGYLLFFLLVSVFEELMFRTIPLFVFAERYHFLFAIIINGLLFGFVHMSNPGFTWLAMLNITLAGALFSIFTLLKKNISWAIGIHFSWNFAQGTLLGYKVSGTNSPGLLTAKPVGDEYLSGGTFGIEGSIFCSILLILLIIWLLVKNKFEPIMPKENLIVEE
ncbi:CPBP family intramembrane metalloprotease [Pedobacter cryotolerans]|uniref:CPBP family intramembrane metalloprotease n=2 Tax=Pedobacter cryotolerans TaxID=2571270 RepID=A0A4U1C4X9_9SPHI|nr:CPBP family intramembrane metalloprotease [Pedobacter cryotolerans]